MTFPSEYWRNALEKKFPTTANVDDPEEGYFREKKGSRVVFWRDTHTTTMRCQVDGKDADQRAGQIWNFVNRSPVTEDAFYFHQDHGRWPDQDAGAKAAELGPEIDPEADPVASLKGEIASAKAGLADYAKIESDEAAGAAQTLRNLLNGLSTKADKLREEEKAPYLKAGREIDAKWQPLVKDAKTSADSLRSAMADWENHKREQLRAAQVAAEAQAETTPGGTVPEVKSNAPAPAAQIKGATGKAAAVTTVKVAEINDWKAVALHFCGNVVVQEALQKVANAAVAAGLSVPGTTIKEKADVR